MIIAPFPLNEDQRLQDLLSYDLLDSAPEEEFNDLVQLASVICKTPISLITLLDKERQWFKAKKGIDVNETERSISFCSHAILTDGVMVVEDAANDIRFSDNPLVTGHGIRFYAGTPIVSPEGYKLGTVCVLDHEPQKFTNEQKKVLELISKQVTKLLELRQKNILIHKKAEESIAFKSQLISRVLIDNENHKRTIANNLHEDLAQRMAYCIHALGAKSAAMHIHVIRDEMNRILTDLRELTYSISPVTDHHFAPGELIDDFINRVAVTFPFQLVLKKSNADECFNPRVSLSIIRMMEEWFRLLLKKQQIRLVQVEVICENDHIQLTIEDDGKLVNGFTQKQQERIGIIQERVQMEEGSLSFHHKPGKSVLKIELPLPAEQIAGTA
ncbi:GAF domain-containing protein [Lacibacter sp. MH-610]|uniref:GAF domain-containing protein n=1 Tax=Lacibacter sp. MH-610 TaxID=3020883 RepID=UPI0038915402